MIARRTLALFAVCALALAAGCSEDPVARIAKLRTQYEVELTSFVVNQVPLVPETPADETAGEADGEEAAAADEGTSDEEGAGDELAPEPVPVRTDVLLDLLIQNRALEPLPGLTVEIIHADTARDEKARYRVWLDTSGIAKGGRSQIAELIEDVAYEEGDAFAVEIRSPIPPEEHGDYREFSG